MNLPSSAIITPTAEKAITRNFELIHSYFDSKDLTAVIATENSRYANVCMLVNILNHPIEFVTKTDEVLF